MEALVAAATNAEFTLGVLITAFLLGLRHGFDVDHLVAITDMTASIPSARRSVFLATLYAAGHALVVLVLGLAAVVLGHRIPSGLDAAMGYVVGTTLVMLGVYVFYSLIRFGRDFRIRSRWMLVAMGIRRAWGWVRWRGRSELVEIEHEHEHAAAGNHHGHESAEPATILPGRTALKTRTHAHRHRHLAQMPADPFKSYGRAAAFGVGMIHGVGAETPTQVLLLLTAAGIGGHVAGIAVLAVFLSGLFTSNTAVAIASALGFMGSVRRSLLYAALAAATGAFSLGVGLAYLLGASGSLPTLF
jgi:hypothetical protein